MFLPSQKVDGEFVMAHKRGKRGNAPFLFALSARSVKQLPSAERGSTGHARD
jgi:hypothetical protein